MINDSLYLIEVLLLWPTLATFSLIIPVRFLVPLYLCFGKQDFVFLEKQQKLLMPTGYTHQEAAGQRQQASKWGEKRVKLINFFLSKVT